MVTLAANPAIDRPVILVVYTDSMHGNGNN